MVLAEHGRGDLTHVLGPLLDRVPLLGAVVEESDDLVPDDRAGGGPNGVTPPISMPVTARASSGAAKDAFRVPSSDRTVRFTASRQGASTTHAA